MLIQKINDNWKMRKLPVKGEASGKWFPAKVPGSVYNDLLLNKQMEDPFWRDNEDKAFALMENDFEYRTEFSVTDKMMKMDLILLRCEGLDTVADIFVNNVPIAHTANMHRIFEFTLDKKALKLKSDNNELRIVFNSPVKWIAEANKKIKADGSSDALEGFPHLRKAH